MRTASCLDNIAEFIVVFVVVVVVDVVYLLSGGCRCCLVTAVIVGFVIVVVYIHVYFYSFFLVVYKSDVIIIALFTSLVAGFIMFVFFFGIALTKLVHNIRMRCGQSEETTFYPAHSLSSSFVISSFPFFLSSILSFVDTPPTMPTMIPPTTHQQQRTETFNNM